LEFFVAISTEMLNTTYRDLRGPLVETFITDTVLLPHLESKGNIKNEGGTYIDRIFTGGAAATGTGVFEGNEVMNMQRKKQIRSYRVEPHRLIAAINIPKIELDRNTGTKAVVQLIKAYPQTFMQAFRQDWESFLLTGVSLGLAFPTKAFYGFCSLAGSYTSGRRTGTENGLVRFEAPASQTVTVQNIPLSQDYFHFTQYGDITSYASHGERRLRSTYRRCAHFADGSRTKGPDVVLMDPDTYDNYDENRFNLIQLKMVADGTENSNTLDNKCMLNKEEQSYHLDRENIAGRPPANDGLTYMLNSDYIEYCQIVPAKLDEFVDRIADQDAVTSKFEMHAAFLFNKFPCHGAVTGGAA